MSINNVSVNDSDGATHAGEEGQVPEPKSDILGWIREGYPNGIPTADVAPLLTLLHGQLGSDHTMTTVLQLVAAGLLNARDAAEASTAHTQPSLLDQRRVSGHLVMGGWPIARLDPSKIDSDDDEAPEEGSYLGRIVTWLRDGYPQGVPDHDYVPLLAILHRRLSPREVKRVARALRRSGNSPAGPDDIAAAITDVTHDEPSEADMIRVRDRLAAKGWPVEFPEP